MEKGKQLLIVDRKIEKAIAKINAIVVSIESDKDEEIKNGDWVKITGGVRATVNMKMTVHSTTHCFYWLKDSKGKMHRRAKTNVEKVIKKSRCKLRYLFYNYVSVCYIHCSWVGLKKTCQLGPVSWILKYPDS